MGISKCFVYLKGLDISFKLYTKTMVSKHECHVHSCEQVVSRL